MARNKYDIDETLQTEFEFSHLKRLARYIRPYRRDLILIIILMTVSSALGMLTPRILMAILDIYIPNGDIKGIVQISLALLLVYSVISISWRIKISVTSRLGQNIIHKTVQCQ